MEEVEEELSILGNLVNIEIGRREKRALCDRCRRPEVVCWCRGVGRGCVGVRSKVVVLQHPHEEKRCLRTAPILSTALPPGHYVEMRGKRFPPSRYPELLALLDSRHTILLYPGEGAVGVEQLAVVGGEQPPYNIVLLDGTWQQAKSIYNNTPHLKGVRQVCLSGQFTSEYIIRTQPTDDALSTVETAALTLATLEQNWALYDSLVGPLRLLCQYQISHGAVPHQSKEQMIVSGRCRKPLGKRTFKKLRKSGARHTEALLAPCVINCAPLQATSNTDTTTSTTSTTTTTTSTTTSTDSCVCGEARKAKNGGSGENGGLFLCGGGGGGSGGGGGGGECVVKDREGCGDVRDEWEGSRDGSDEARVESGEFEGKKGSKDGNKETEEGSDELKVESDECKENSDEFKEKEAFKDENKNKGDDYKEKSDDLRQKSDDLRQKSDDLREENKEVRKKQEDTEKEEEERNTNEEEEEDKEEEIERERKREEEKRESKIKVRNISSHVSWELR